MSHEIRTPMYAVTGLSELILQQTEDKTIYNYANDIKGASEGLLHIINDILDLSKIEAGRYELVCEEYYTQSLIHDVLVIIGYTFPFFNRDTDRKILQYIKPNTKIYIQDLNPERIKQSLMAVLPDFPEEQIFLRKDVDQFFLPPEL